jgi:quinol-cytochrome oxidoreductase complex cytochrome b subunit
VRVAAIICEIAAALCAIIGIRFLFAGDWLESHTVRYGPLVLLVGAIIAAIAAIVLAAVGAIRRPRDAASWVVVAIVILPVPVGILGIRMLGI